MYNRLEKTFKCSGKIIYAGLKITNPNFLFRQKFKLEMTAKFKIKKRAGEKKKGDAVCEGRDKTTTRTHNIYYAIF